MGGLWIERVCTELDCDTLDTLRWLPYLLLLLLCCLLRCLLLRCLLLLLLLLLRRCAGEAVVAQSRFSKKGAQNSSSIGPVDLCRCCLFGHDVCGCRVCRLLLLRHLLLLLRRWLLLLRGGDRDAPVAGGSGERCVGSGEAAIP